jgi:two-component system chemotaxis sensor kinase CheA
MVETSATVPATKEGLATNVEILRVNASKIDFLMDLVGELVINRSMLNQLCNQLKIEFPKHTKIRKLMDTDSYLGRLLGQLQKTVMEVRMISLDQTFNRFFRVVRDLARDGGKQVELSIVGEETELDKRVVDTIYEPLLHLVRNAVDHGIESMEERVKTGKPPQGKLQLKAYYQADQVIIEISDDGRGINVEKLKQKVVERQLRTLEEVQMLKNQDAYDLMFLSGISTANQVTEVSGRGIGMQVVKTVISNLKGSIEINSQLKQGTTFILRLPLTLAIIRTMLFSIEERVFAIPLTSVVEIIRLNKNDIKHIGKHKVFSRNDEVYSLIDLDSILLGKDKNYNNSFVLIVGLGERRIGLIVEKVIGEREVVVKAVDKQWITSELVAGASILGDGRVVLILDIGALFQRTNLAMSAKQ